MLNNSIRKVNGFELNSNSEPKLTFFPSVPRISVSTQETLRQTQIFHRSDTFRQLIDETSEMILNILGCNDYTPILASGNGTLANEIMLANFTNARCPLVLVNGEFGERLAHQCSRYRHNSFVFEAGWGKSFDLGLLKNYLQKNGEIDTIFFVAVETSVGMINPVKEICNLAEQLGQKVGIDAVSALGAVPIDYTSKAIVCITSSSGKALLSIPGVLIIFIRHNNLSVVNDNIPHVLDIKSLLAARYSSPGCVRNTLSSVLVYALHHAVANILNEGLSECYNRGHSLKAYLLEEMKAISINPLANSDCPIVTSFERPNSVKWENIRHYLRQRDIAVYDNASYLEKRNLFQVATFGNYSLNDIFCLTNALKECLLREN